MFVFMRVLLRIIIVFILLLFSVACIRQSGRKSISRKTSSNQIYEKSDEKNYKAYNKSSNSHRSKNLKKLTGTEVFESYNSAVFMVFTSDGLNIFQGSGFFISEDGLAVSNYHVFKGTGIGYERIKLANNKVYTIESVLARSEEDDLIIFQLESNGDKFNYIPLALSNPKVGEDVYTIGSPYGFENTFSSGEISQLRGENIIQINAPIDHGSSGGALINSYGEVIGITTSGIGASQANLNFAININVIKKYLAN